ncbi:hypothetical protein [Actinoplanes sp. DH11]|uniref:hypothetical protein n=1 Tax=Actinoplanes sp. DH11 TaxID=2857011 RepID=UPI001E2DB260|nr:hypothetical protein [Actinoplanes sp. DH11]
MTIDGAGQHREHEQITRAAVACYAARTADGDCFDPRSVDHLGLPGPSPVLDLRGTAAPAKPPGLTTGCFVLSDRVPGTGSCERRITHAALNKDNGLVDPRSGVATGAATPRGQVGRNFAAAVAGAIVETRHQWQDFRRALADEYGAAGASLMACALTHDDPPDQCRAPRSARDGFHRTAAGLGLAIVLLALCAGGLAAVVRRRRRG